MAEPTAQLRKDNHYVPQLYLKQWMRNEKIPTYRLIVPHENCRPWKDKSPKSIAFLQHFYTYHVAGKGDTDEFERWLDSEFESPAEEAITRVVNGRQLTAEHWRNLIRFAVAQGVRTPAHFREFMERQSSTLEPLLKDVTSTAVHKWEQATKRRVPVSGASPDNTTSPRFDVPLNVSVERTPDGDGLLKVSTTLGRKLWIESCRYLLSHTVSRLLSQRWTILHAPDGMTWPTSDNPVVRLNFIDDSNYDFHGGWDRTNGNIFLPLSPKHLMFTQVRSSLPRRGTVLSKPYAQKIRKMIIEHADRYIFSIEESDIQSIRPRKVDPIALKRERQMWQTWHEVQSKAEAAYSFKNSTKR
jgi:hypothetical protein